MALNLHDDIPPNIRSITQSLILCSTIFVIGLFGGPLVRATWTEIRRARITIELLFLLTLLGAMAGSLQAHLTGEGKIYFEVVSILLVIFTVGKRIVAESRTLAMASTRSGSTHLLKCRRVDEDGVARSIPVSKIELGDCVEVYAGETISVDGTISEGDGFISEAPVTGEPFSVVRRPGDRGFAGSASCDATFRIRATSRGMERHIDLLLAFVEDAQKQPISMQSHADRLAKLFVPIVVLVSLGTFGYWTFLANRGWHVGLFNAMSVLLVACPCALGLATPIIFWKAIGRLAERGLLVRGGDVVQRLAQVDFVCIDKTGTLSEAQFLLLEVVTSEDIGERTRILGWVALLQLHSNHPMAHPFSEFSTYIDTKSRVLNVKTISGCGIEGQIEESSGMRHVIRIGRPDWIGLSNVKLDSLTIDAPGRRVHVAIDGELAAIALLAERFRESTGETLEAFCNLKLRVEVLTGDASERLTLWDVPVRTGLSPEEKRTRIEELTMAGGKPLMIGDGINDASALAAAHVGIALASGTDLAVQAANATLYHGDLCVLPWAIELSRAAVRAVRRNLFRAMIYNFIGMTLAALGILHPIAAVLLMMASSLSLIFSAKQFPTAGSHCNDSHDTKSLDWFRIRGLIHGFGFALQSLAILLLLESARDAANGFALVAGVVVAASVSMLVWRKWSSIPHSIDMCYGMLTLGNLGMLLGWWADLGFRPVSEGSCRECVETLQRGALSPGMCLGMLAFSNLAMFGLSRRRLPRGSTHNVSMVTGGNLGMMCGMILGGWCAAQFAVSSTGSAFAMSFGGMTIGMMAGMLGGTLLVEHLLGAVQIFRRRRRVLDTSASARVIHTVE